MVMTIMSIMRYSFNLVRTALSLNHSKTHELIDKMRQKIEIAIDKMHNTELGVDCRVVLNELKESLVAINASRQIQGIDESNLPPDTYRKLIEKFFNPDISKAYINVEEDIYTLNLIIANHFYHQGLFYIGDDFVNEVGEVYGVIMKPAFLEMYQIVEAMKNEDLEPALKWVANNSVKLVQSGSDLELKLHSMQFVKMLQNQRNYEALDYARTYLSSFRFTHRAEMQKLMACFLWTGNLDQSSYQELLSSSDWERLAENFKRQFCNLLGQSYNSSLSVALAAGAKVLFSTLRIKNFMVHAKQKWESMYFLPVPVDLDREFQFHSFFVCPLSKEQATDDNPPMLMSCGHVLCKQSISMMSTNGMMVFNCPYL